MVCKSCGCYVPNNFLKCPSCSVSIDQPKPKPSDYSVVINLNGESVNAYIGNLEINYEQLPDGIIRKFEITAIEYEPSLKNQNRGDNHSRPV